MKNITLLALLLFSLFSFTTFAQTAPDAGATNADITALTDKAVTFDFATWTADPANLEAASKLILTAIQHGNWALLVSALVTLIIALLRKFIPAHTIVGKWVASRTGAIVTNLLLSVGGGFTTAFASGEPVSLALVLKALSVAFTAAGIWSVWKNIAEAATAKKAAEAGKAATESPKQTLDK